MSDNDLIRRGDAVAAAANLYKWSIAAGEELEAAIHAIPAADADPVCTGCGGTGVTYQTERRCACQGPDLTDPVTVHANMLRGSIAKPTVEQIVHLYGCEAFQPMIDAAIAKALERACLAVSEHADWPEDEHGRTEQVELFARVINAIRAITPALSPSTDARAEALREAAARIRKGVAEGCTSVELATERAAVICEAMIEAETKP